MGFDNSDSVGTLRFVGSRYSARSEIERRGGWMVPLTLLFALQCCWGIGALFAQESRVEDRVPASLVDDQGVLIALERLRQLRMTEGRFGERHPALKSIRSQIETLESELENKFQEESLKSNGMQLGGDVNGGDGGGWSREWGESFGGVPNRLEVATDRVGRLDGAIGKHVWSRELRASWGETLKKAQVLTGERYRLAEAYPNLRFRNLKTLGAFPALGLMWGIENAADDSYGCLWQWVDDSRIANRAALLEVSQRMTGVVFAADFEQSGGMVVSMVSRDPGNGVRRVEVWRYRLRTAPPFGLETEPGELVATGTSRAVLMGNLHRLPNGGLAMELGVGSALVGAGAEVSIAEIREGVWGLSMEDFGKGRSRQVGVDPAGAVQRDASCWVMCVSGKDVLVKDLRGIRENLSLTEIFRNRSLIGGLEDRSEGLASAQASDLQWIVVDSALGEVLRTSDSSDTPGGNEVLAKTTRKLVGMGVDPHGMPMVIDEDGTILRLELQPSVSESMVMPRTLGETGWYLGLGEGVLEDAFVSVLVDGVGLGKGLRNDVWVCVPEGKWIDISHGDAWSYPEGTLILQTIRTEVGSGTPSAGSRRLETQVLVRKTDAWRPYRYVWNEAQSDALLVEFREGRDGDSGSASELGLEGGIKLDQVRCNECHVGQGNRYLIRFESHCRGEDEGGAGGQGVMETLMNRGLMGTRQVRQVDATARGRVRREGLVAEPFEGLGKSVLDPVGIDTALMGSDLVDGHLRHWLAGSRVANGNFRTRFDEEWNPDPEERGNVSRQSQMLYCLAAGYAITKDKSYEEALLSGGDFLLKHYRDMQEGGFFWAVDESGKLRDSRKSLRGNAHAILGLIAVGRATKRPEYTEAASRCWEVLRLRMKHSVGGYYARGSRDFDYVEGCSSASLMDLYEALLGLQEQTGSNSVARDAEQLLEFVLKRLWQDGGYIPDLFEADWRAPSVQDRALTIELADQLKWAYLLSEGARLGRTREHMKQGHALVDFSISHGVDEAKGGIGQYENRWVKGTWQQAEFMRTMLRYADQHGRESLKPQIAKTQEYINESCRDVEHGGWVLAIGEGAVAKRMVPFHEVGMHMEGVRVGQGVAAARRRAGR